MTFEEQIINAKIRIDTTPRVYVEWENSEPYRDRTDCYERKTMGNIIYYENVHNRDQWYTSGNPFFDILEKIYNNIKQ